MTGPLSHGLCSRVAEAVVGANHEGVKSIFRVEIAAADGDMVWQAGRGAILQGTWRMGARASYHREAVAEVAIGPTKVMVSVWTRAAAGNVSQAVTGGAK